MVPDPSTEDSSWRVGLTDPKFAAQIPSKVSKTNNSFLMLSESVSWGLEIGIKEWQLVSYIMERFLFHNWRCNSWTHFARWRSTSVHERCQSKLVWHAKNPAHSNMVTTNWKDFCQRLTPEKGFWSALSLRKKPWWKYNQWIPQEHRNLTGDCRKKRQEKKQFQCCAIRMLF